MTHTFHAAGTQLPEHAHPYAAITLGLAGAFTESFGQVAHRCQPLGLLFKPAEMPHTNTYHAAGAASFVIELMPEATEALEPFVDVAGTTTHMGHGALSALALQAYAHFRAGGTASLLHAEELIVRLLKQREACSQVRQHGPPPPWLRNVRDYIQANYTEPLRLSGLAQLVAVHPVHLARCFRQHYGCSVGTYVHRCRIDHAVFALAQHPGPIAPLAYAMGYSDQSHFSRRFTRAAGISPAAFQTTCRHCLH